MRRQSNLPAEFEFLSGKVHYVHEVVAGTEWASSCPSCGGEIHRNGEWPDRFRMWPKSKHGTPLGWCRHCNAKFTPKQEFKPDPALLEKLRLEREKADAEHIAAVKKARIIVQREKKWEVYNFNLLKNISANLRWCEVLGVNEANIDQYTSYWKLGCDPHHTFWNMNGNEQFKSFVSPTLTFPLCDLNGKAINIKHRLLKIGPDGLRYRQEYRGTGEGIFIANRGLMNKADWVILAEGEKKAMVSYICVGGNTKLQIFGLPMTPSLELLGAINGKHILYIPDPDVFEDGKRMAMNRVMSVFAQRDLHIVRLPAKLDDYIIDNHKDSAWLLAMWKLPKWTMEVPYYAYN